MIKLRRYWEGYLNGTNRGRAFAVMTCEGNSLRAKVLLYDQAFGPAVLWFRGQLDGGAATLHIVRQRSSAPVQPLDGEVSATFSGNGSDVQGTWRTDIGTAGGLRLQRATFWRVHWAARRLAVAARMLWYRAIPTLYAASLLGLAVASALDKCRISWQALVLLLVPAPLLFQNRIAGLVAQLRIRKAGPVEFQQEQSLAPDMSRLVAFLDERLRFAGMDVGFVPRTKLLLMWLASLSSANRDAFAAAAKSVGVEGENLAATLGVLFTSGCIETKDEAIALTQFGRRYVGYLRSVPQGGSGK